MNALDSVVDAFDCPSEGRAPRDYGQDSPACRYQMIAVASYTSMEDLDVRALLSDTFEALDSITRPNLAGIA